MELLTYNDAYQELIENYRLSENHLRFTRLPQVAVASKDPSRTHMLAMQAGELVTFFTLSRGEIAQQLAQNEQAILISSFSTDARHQGNGYAKEALQLLPMYIQSYFPDINEVVLAVNCQNNAAQGLYAGCGFFDTYERCEGRCGTVNIMKMEIVREKQLV